MLGYRAPARGNGTHEEIISSQVGKLQPDLPDIFHQRLSFSHYFCYEHMLSPRGNSRDGGALSVSLGPLCFTRAQAEICAGLDCAHLRCDRTFLQQTHPCLCVRYLQQHSPSLLNFCEEAAGVLQAAVLLLVSPRTALKPKKCCQPSFKQ